MTKRRERLTMIDKTLHIKLNIQKHKPQIVSVLHFPLNGIRRHVTHVTSICIGISTFTSCMIVDVCCCHSGTLISRYLNCRGLRVSGRVRENYSIYGGLK
jgi:hypothetical protein